MEMDVKKMEAIEVCDEYTNTNERNESRMPSK